MLPAYRASFADDKIRVFWNHPNEKTIRQPRALYACLDPQTNEVLLIGKAFRQSVHDRLKCRSKYPVWDWARKQGINQVKILVGTIAHNGNLTDQLLFDIETLLISSLQPPGNIANSYSRNFSRRGMVVKCIGKWPHPIKEFVDN